MQLSAELTDKLGNALEPINGETASAYELGRLGRLAVSSLGQYVTARDALDVFSGRGSKGYAEAVVSRRMHAGLTDAMSEQLKHLADLMSQISHIDASFVPLTTELRQELTLQDKSPNL